jgi:ribonuclease VapC
MIVDTSALVAIVMAEAGHQVLIGAVTDSTAVVGIGSPTVAELGLVLSARLDIDARPLVAGLLEQFEIVTVPFGDAHWRQAVDAFVRFGRGRHRAALNFGDCLTYAVARLANEPLLYVGDDFSHTDLMPI